MIDRQKVIRTIPEYGPDVQAIYIYGSMAAEKGPIMPDSDLDLALLLCHSQKSKPLMFTELHEKSVSLVNSQ